MTIDARERAWRRVLFVAAPGWAIFYPIWLVYITFDTDDALYRYSLVSPDSGTSMVEEYRKAAAALETSDGFLCIMDIEYQHRFGDDRFDERDLPFHIWRRIEGEAYSRRLATNAVRVSGILYYVDHIEWRFLQKGRALNEEYSRAWREFWPFKDNKMVPFCKRQVTRAKHGNPLLPPLRIDDELREVYLRAADGLEAALNDYAEVRMAPLRFFQAWIAYTAFSFLFLGAYGLHVYSNYRRRSAANDSPSIPTNRPQTRSPAQARREKKRRRKR